MATDHSPQVQYLMLQAQGVKNWVQFNRTDRWRDRSSVAGLVAYREARRHHANRLGVGTDSCSFLVSKDFRHNRFLFGRLINDR